MRSRMLCFALLLVACDPGARRDGDDEITLPVCGDAVVNDGESCDPPSASLECAYGEASCSRCGPTCALVSGTVVGYCGDGVVQPVHGEACDGTPTTSCSEQGYRLGGAACIGCQDDLSACSAPAIADVWFDGRSELCVRDVFGALACMGANAEFAPSDGPFSALAGNDVFVCALREADGSLRCWSPGGGLATPSGSFSRIRARADTVTAFTAEGAFVAVSNSGIAAQGRDVRDVLVTSGGVIASIDVDGLLTSSYVFPSDVTYSSLSGNATQPCALTTAGDVLCVQNGTLTQQGSDAVYLDSNDLHPFYLTSDGRLYGEVMEYSLRAPYRFASLDETRAIGCGATVDGDARCFGAALWGQTLDWRGRYAGLAASGESVCGIDAERRLHCKGIASVETPPVGATRRPAPGVYLAADGTLLGTALPAGRYRDVSGSCVIREPDGALSCSGALGARAPTGLGFRSVVTRFDAVACAIDTNEGVVCWRNTDGSVPEFSAGPWHFVSSTATGMVAIRDDGTWERRSVDNTVSTGDFGNGVVAVRGGHSYEPLPGGGGSFVEKGVVLTEDDTVLAVHDGSLLATGPFSAITDECGLGTDGLLVCWHGAAPRGQFANLIAGLGICAIDAEGVPGCFDPNGTSVATVNELAWDRPAPSIWAACDVDAEGLLQCFNTDQPTGAFVPGSLAASFRTFCGIEGGGSLSCFSQSGLTSTEPPELLTPPPGAYVDVDLSPMFACAVSTTGSLSCWGGSLTPTPPSGSDYVKVAVGAIDACALRTDGTLRCFNKFFANVAAPSGTFVQLEGYAGMCARTAAGEIVCWGDDAPGFEDPPAGPFSDLAVGSGFACGLRGPGADAGLIECWGSERTIAAL